METTVQELTKNRLYSAGITLVVLFLLALFLIAYRVVSPHLQFQNGNTTPSQQFALSVFQAGSTHPNYTISSFLETAKAEAISVVKNAEPIVVPPSQKPETNFTTPSSEAKAISSTYNKKLHTENSPVITSPEGPEGSSTTASIGNTTEAAVPAVATGQGKFGFSLIGRTIEQPPQFKSTSNEEGTVVVDITVNKAGEVIEANPNGRGTTTSSALLKAKAAEAARSVKFNADTKFEEQTGTITIVFSFN